MEEGVGGRGSCKWGGESGGGCQEIEEEERGEVRIGGGRGSCTWRSERWRRPSEVAEAEVRC